MKQTSLDTIYIEDIVPSSLFQSKSFSDGINAFFWPKSKNDEIEILKKLETKRNKYYIWRRNRIPSEFHFKNNKLIAPIVISAKENFTIKMKVGMTHES